MSTITETRISIDDAIEQLVEQFGEQLDADCDEEATRLTEEYRTRLESDSDDITNEWRRQFDEHAEFEIADDGENAIVIN